MMNIFIVLASPLDRFSQRAYMRVTGYILKRFGVQVTGRPLWISPRVFWDSPKHGLIAVGDRVVISHYVKLLTHDFSMDRIAERRDGLSELEYFVRKPIVIGDCSFVGMGATIMPGVVIGAGAIVGTMAVVTKDVAPDTVVAGNPARVIATSSEVWRRNHQTYERGRRRG